MLKQIMWRNGNKMEISTGHVTFDRQTNVISTGNIIAKTQFGFYIRPFCEIECNGRGWPEGYLQMCDIKYFDMLPRQVLEAIDRFGQCNATILYRFSHLGPGKKRIVHGYIFTDKHYNLLMKFYTGPTHLSHQVIEGVLPYVVNQ